MAVLQPEALAREADGRRGRTLPSIDPNTGELLGEVPLCGEAEVRAAVLRAREAQPAWAARPLQERIEVLRQVQEVFVDQADEVAQLASREMGKIESESLVGDVLLTLTSLDGYLRLAPSVLRTRRLRHGLLHLTKRSYVVYEPLGVVAVISPYNFPVLLSMQSAFAALIAGNAVVHKPSEHTPLTALKVREILLEGGVPEEVFQVVTGDGATGWALVHAGVDHVSFVGSSQTGRKVAAAAGEQLISATMELGGKNPMIVLEDAPLERAVNAALTYAFAANGQVCGSVSRLLVHESVADRFLAGLRAGLEAWRVGREVRPGGVQTSAVVSEAICRRIEGHVRQALDQGAVALVGGERADAEAPVFRPTVLVNVPEGAKVLQEETFGPVVTVRTFRDEDEAVRIANATPYGLTASVWTRSASRAWRIARALEAGTVAVNDHLWPFFAPDVAWGGVKASGLGRVGGEWGLRAMTYPKVVSFDRLNLRREFYWHPATARMHQVIRALVPLLYSRRLRKRLAGLKALLGTLLRGSH